MKALWKGFSTYAVIGLVNTFIHWQVFFVLVNAAELTQATSNFAAFCAAASFSFYANALYTFDAKVSILRYLLFVCVMGVLSFGVGFLADQWRIHGLLTVTTFSLLSLFCGFLFSSFVGFCERKA